MESHLWSTIFLVLLSYYIILQLVFNFKQRKSPQNFAKLPPSPPKLPVIGHLHLLSGGLLQHVLSGISQKYGPVVHLQLGEIFSVVVSSPEATKQLMKEQDLACSDKVDRIGTKVMFYDSNDLACSPYSMHWRQMRKLFVSQLLSARNVRSFGLIRQEEVSRLVLSLRSSASAGQAVDLTEKTCALMCSIICRAVFGSVIEDVDVLKGLVNDAMPMVTGYELVDVLPSSKLVNLLYWNKYKLRRMHHRVDAILERIVEEHRLKPGRDQFEGEEDIIDVMLRMEKDDHLQVPITRDAIKGFIFDAFAAGTESSTNTINWAMAELMRNPAVMTKAQTEIREALKGKTSVDVSDVQELKYLKSVVKETLRLHPPIPLILRQCREECEVNGYTIPKKTRITINVWSMGRDPTYWDEPEMFQPERFDDVSREFMGNDFEFIPFGAGRRICPALSFGVANVEIPLAQLLYHFDWKLPKGMNLANMVDMTDAKGYTGARENPLFLVPTPYIPSMETS